MKNIYEVKDQETDGESKVESRGVEYASTDNP